MKEQMTDTFSLGVLIESKVLLFNDYCFINIDTLGPVLAVIKDMRNHIQRPSVNGTYLTIINEFFCNIIFLVYDIDKFLFKTTFVKLVRNGRMQGGAKRCRLAPTMHICSR